MKTNGSCSAWLLGLGGSVLALGALAAPPALAQEQTTGANDTIVVVGIRGSLQRSIDQRRNAINTVDAITAEQMGKLPDNNLAEALQRIPGVTIDRSELGEGTQINLRGLGPAFTRSEINGGSAFNGFDFSVLASELFSRITVEKSPTAASTEGGLAGAVHSETARPFDNPGFHLAGVASASDGQLGDTVGRYFAQVSNTWGNQVGVTAAIAYSETDFRTNQISFGSWQPLQGALDPSFVPATPADLLAAYSPRTTGYYSYIQQRENFGGALTLEARPTASLDFGVDAIYATSDSQRFDDRPDAPVEGGRQPPTTYTIDNGTITAAHFENIQNRIGTSYRPATDDVFQINLRAQWRPNDAWTIRPQLTFSQHDTDQQLQLFSFAINGADLNYTINGRFPNFTSSFTDFSSNPEDFGLNVFFFDENQVEETESIARIDFERRFDWPGLNVIKFGLRYTDRSSDAFGRFSVLVPGMPLLDGKPATLDAVAISREFDVQGAPSSVPHSILAVDPTRAASLYYPGLDPWTSTEFFLDPNDTALRTYNIGEQTLAGYVMADAEFGPLMLNAGVRVVQTKTDATGSQSVDNGVVAFSGSNDYTSFLPSLNARYSLSDNMLLRASYSRIVNRPGLNDLRPAAIINSGPRTAEGGNPSLLPYTADQIDLGWEWYFGDDGLLNINAFWKEIDSLIVFDTTDRVATIRDQTTQQLIQAPVAFTQPVNGDNARVTGVEIGAQSSFFFLPEVFHNFGGIANYTFADSESTSTSSGGTRTTTLPGLSPHSLNLILYYDNGAGLDARLAYAWRSQYLRDDAVGRQFGAERYIDDFGQLDFSLNVPLGSYLRVGLTVLNVLDEQRFEDTKLTNGSFRPTNVLELERRTFLTLRSNF